MTREDTWCQWHSSPLLSQSCCQGMKELTDHLLEMVEEAKDLDGKIREFRVGLRQQVDSILSTPPPRSLLPRRADVTPESEDRGLRQEREPFGALQ